MNPELAHVLAEKDRRATETARLLAGKAAETVVVRLSARLPATLRSTDRAAIALAIGARRFAGRCRSAGIDLGQADTGTSSLGPWTTWLSCADPHRLKQICVATEDDGALGSLLDLDVETSDGHLGREQLGLPPRACAVCGEAALVCSGRQRHSPGQVQAAFSRLLTLALHVSGSAVGVYRGQDTQTHRGGDTP